MAYEKCIQQGTGACGTSYSGTIIKVGAVQVGTYYMRVLTWLAADLMSKYNISHALSSNRQQL